MPTCEKTTGHVVFRSQADSEYGESVNVEPVSSAFRPNHSHLTTA